MTNTPQRHHTVSAGYIGRYSRNRKVTVHHATEGVFETGRRAVGFQNNFWGSEDLSREVEQAFNKCEDPVLRMLRNIPQRWPLSTEDRAALAQFVAIHVIRTPAFGAFARRAGDRALEASVREVAEKHGIPADQLAAAAQGMKGQRHHVHTLLGQIGRIGSMFSNMQWNLVQFDHDWLITSDQPVVMLPLRQVPVSPASSVPASGFSNTVEAFFTLDPRQLLLMTWVEAPDSAQPLSGTYRQACSINCALRAQSLTEWVSRPGVTPPFHAPPVLEPSIYAISTEPLPGYTLQAATRSRRRAAADQLMSKVIKENAPRDRMTWVTFKPPIGRSSLAVPS
jgi:hypothetical protein